MMGTNATDHLMSVKTKRVSARNRQFGSEYSMADVDQILSRAADYCLACKRQGTVAMVTGCRQK
jgi:hypothetical protein